jgi:dihydroorotate dehydrogenase
VTIWNNAVRSQKAADLDSAANNFRATAKYLRTLTAAPADKQFTPLVAKLAKDFEDMADARKARRTVSTSTYNTDAQKMRQYCTTKISA